MTNKHTATPWDKIWADYDGKIIIENNGVVINNHPSMWQKDQDALDEANAAFIVRACNAHDELVRLLEEATNNKTYRQGFYTEVEKTLAKAKGDA